MDHFSTLSLSDEVKIAWNIFCKQMGNFPIWKAFHFAKAERKDMFFISAGQKIVKSTKPY